jgi:hypothetical protein
MDVFPGETAFARQEDSPLQSFFTTPGLMIGMAIGVFAVHSLGFQLREFPEELGIQESAASCVSNRAQVRLNWSQIQEERQQLERARVRLHLSCHALDHITVRLVIAELTLRQAVEMADPLLRRRSGFWSSMAGQYMGLSHQQMIARFLIQRAEMMYGATDPSFWHPVAQRLEREYAALE